MSTLKRIDPLSADTCHSGFNLFSVPPTNSSVVKASVREILPLNATDDPATERHEFRIFSDNQWLDLSRTYVYLQLKLQKKVGQQWTDIDINADTNLATCQTLGQSYIKQLRVAIGGTEVYDSSQHYPYLCYMKNELNYSTSVKDTILMAAGYARDTEMNNADSPGFKMRNLQIGQGVPVEFLSRLDFDLANQNRFLVNNVDVFFTISKMDDDFLIHKLNLTDTNQYRVRALSVRLYVVAVDAQPALNLAIAQTMEKQSAKYPIRRMEVHSNYISAGRSEFVHNMFTNVIPRCVILGLVEGAAYDGDPKLDPFKFEPFDVRDITINAAGLNYPSVNYNFNWDANKGPVSFVRGYVDMMEACKSEPNLTNGITMTQFKDGWTIFVIPLNATLNDCGGVDPVRNGTTTLHLRFNDKLKKGVNVVYIGEFDQVLTVDSTRAVVSDTSVTPM
jgi:hypothetical protein